MQTQSYVEEPQGGGGAGTVHAEGMFGTITSARHGIQSSARNSGRAAGEVHAQGAQQPQHVAAAASGSEYDAYGLGGGEPANSRAGSNAGPPVSSGNMALIIFCLGLAAVMLITLRHKVYKQVRTPPPGGVICPWAGIMKCRYVGCLPPLAVAKATLTTHAGLGGVDCAAGHVRAAQTRHGGGRATATGGPRGRLRRRRPARRVQYLRSVVAVNTALDISTEVAE